MNQDQLKYGDLIILHGTSSLNSPNIEVSPKKSLALIPEQVGFLSALGFTDNRVFLQQTSDLASDPLTAAGELNNTKDLIFQIWPKVTCEAHKQMRKLKKEQKFMIGFTDDDDKNITADIVGRLHARIAEEKKAGYRTLSHVIGIPVVYGSEVQFMHYNSKSFLKADLSCSSADKNAYRFELSKEFSTKMVFRIQPRYSIRQEGEPIQYGDQILINYSKLGCYVNFSTNFPVEIDTPVNFPNEEATITEPYENKKLSESSTRFEAYISQFQDCIWRVYYFGTQKEQDPIVVKGRDLIRLRHIEQPAFLGGELCLRSRDPEVYGRIYTGEDEAEHDSLNTIWEVETDNHQSLGGECHILDSNGGYKGIRLRHLMTGRVLSLGDVDVGLEISQIPVLKQQKKDSSYSIIFHCFANKPKKEMYYNTAYSIGFVVPENAGDKQTSLIDFEEEARKREGRENAHEFITMSMDKDYGALKASMTNLEVLNNSNEVREDDLKLFRRLRESEFSIKKRVVFAESAEPSAEYAYLIQRVDPERALDMFFVESSLPMLNHFKMLIKSCRSLAEIPWETVQRVLSVLKNLIFFVHNLNMDVTKRHDAIKYEGEVVEHRQKLMKDFRIIEILTEILYYPFHREILDLNNITEPEYKLIFQCCYRLIKHIIKEYRPNEVYASQWLGFYMSQALASDQKNDIKAEATLTELIDNNKRILDSRIDKDIITKFVHTLIERKHEKFVKLLQALIVCDGEAVLKNQTETSKQIFGDENIYKELIFNIRVRQGQPEIYIDDLAEEDPEARWLNFPAFHLISEERDKGEQYGYFISLISLFSDLCLERNYIAINFLQGIYTRETCFAIISQNFDGKVWDLKSVFARLMNAIWIDKEPYQPMNLPRYVFFCEEIYETPGQEIISAQINNNEFEGLKDYLQEYFTGLAEEGCTQIYEVERNRFTLMALQMTITLTSFGFYPTVNKLKSLVKPLLVLLNGMRDVTSSQEYRLFQSELKKPKEVHMVVKKTIAKKLLQQSKYLMLSLNPNQQKTNLRHVNTEESLIVMECKDRICELIKIVTNIANDLIIRKFLFSFKSKRDNALRASPCLSDDKSSMSRKLCTGDQRVESEPDSDQYNEAELIYKISKDDSLNMSKLAPVDFDKLLFDLLHYEHSGLIRSAFELLHITHSKQIYLKETLSQVRIIEDIDKKEVVKTIENNINSLRELSETSETWYGLDPREEQEDNYNKCLEIIQVFQNALIVSSNVILGEGYEDEGMHEREGEKGDSGNSFDSDSVHIVALDEAFGSFKPAKGSVDKMRDEGVKTISYEFQHIFRYLKAYEPLMEIIRFEHALDDDEKAREPREELLTEIIRFLKRFIYKQKANQDLLSGDIKLFFRMIKRYPNCGAEALIEELFRNNKSLVKQMDYVEKFARYMIRLLENNIREPSYRNARLLGALNVLMMYKNLPMKQNQILIMSFFTSRNYESTILSILGTRKASALRQMLREYDCAYEKQLNTPTVIELEPEIDYATSLLLVMACSTDGKNAVTESKIQGLIPLTQILFLYESSKYCWYLKYALLSLFYRAYLETERERRDETAKLNRLFELILADMEACLVDQGKNEIFCHKGYIPVKRFQDMLIFKGILPCLEEGLKKRLFKVVSSFEAALPRILDLLLKLNALVADSPHQKKVKSIIHTFQMHAEHIYTQYNKQHPIRTETLMTLSIVNGDQNTFRESFAFNVGDRDPRTQRLKTVMLQLHNDNSFKSHLEDEFNSLVNSLVNIERIQDETNVLSAPVPLNRVLKSLINLIDVQEKVLDDNLSLIALRILRKVIERESKIDSAIPAADWEAEAFTSHLARIVERQNNLCGLGLVEKICDMVSICQDPDLQLECLLLSIALLLGGNVEVQKAFLTYIQEDTHNSFLLQIKKLIVESFDHVKKAMTERNKRHYKKALYIIEKDIDEENAEEKIKVHDQVLPKEEEEFPEDNGGGLEDFQALLVLLKRVYRFLQLLCEGHNFEVQSQLRVQKTSAGTVNRKSYDFISHTAYYLNTLAKQINIDSLNTCVQILDFLIEAVQGPCEENQMALAKANIINSSMDFLMTFNKKSDYMKRGFLTKEQRNQTNEATTKSVKLLNALIEGDTHPEIFEEMNSLDFNFMIRKLSVYYENFVSSKLKLNPKTAQPTIVTNKMNQDSFDQKMLESFDVYILLANLADLNQNVRDKLVNTADYTELERNALEFYQINTANIELLFKERLLKIYFPIYPACRFLTSNAKDDLMENVNRSSPNEKIMGLVNASPKLFDEMEHLVSLHSNTFSFSTKWYNLLRDFSTLLSLIINIILISTTYYVVIDGESVKTSQDFGGYNSQQVIKGLGWVQITTSILMIVYWVQINSGMIFRERWRNYLKKKKISKEESHEIEHIHEDQDLGELPLQTSLTLLWTKGPGSPFFNKNGKMEFKHNFVRLIYYYKNLIFVLSDGRFVFLLFYLIVSILGCAVSEITYCLHLLDVINRFNTLRNVIKSVTYNLKQLMLTGLLGLILIYIYALLGFNFIDASYYDSDISERTCSTMFQCYITTLNWGLRNGGGIGDTLQKPSYEKETRNTFYFRAVFDLTFFLIINIVFLNIIFGIIIDTFAELRDEKKVIDEDIMNRCYICSIERSTFDKNGEGFEDHIKKNHHLWNYLFFMYAIKTKDPTEYNGIESYVQEKVIFYTKDRS